MDALKPLLYQPPSAFVAITVATTLALLPGYVILDVFPVFRRIDILTRLCISPGISISFYVLLFTLCYKLGIRLGPSTPWLICAIAILALSVKHFSEDPSLLNKQEWARIYTQTRSYLRSRSLSDKLACVLFVVACGTIVVANVLQARGLITPPGSDSIHHTMIVQLMLDHGGLFTSWMPYDDVSRFTYHFGFHAITTMYAWMRGMSAEFSVLMMGQMICALAAIGVIALVRLFTHDLWAALFAAITAGLVSEFPFTFINSGRYTQPAGQVLFFAGLVLLATYLKQPRSRINIPYLILLPTVIAGLGLAHYKVAITFVAFAVTLVGYEALKRWHSHERFNNALIASFGRATVIAGLAILIFSMRGLTVLKGVNGTRLNNLVTVTATETQLDQQATTIDAITFTRTGFSDNELTIWWLACAGIVIILVERRSATWFLLGGVLCWFLMYPQTLGIKRIGILDVGHLRLSVYIFLAVLSGLAVGWFVKLITTQKQIYIWLLAASSTILVVVTSSSLPSVLPGSIYTTSNDIQMMTWIRDNLPSEVHLAARGFAWTGGGFAFGVDGGNWLPYYTHHLTNLSDLGTATEKDPNSLIKKQINAQFTEAMYQRDMSTPGSAVWLHENGFDYFFLGSRPDNELQQRDIILVQQLTHNPSLQVVHQVGDTLLLGIQ